MFCKLENEQVNWYFGIPRWMVVSNLSEIGLNSNFLLVYCYLDRWRNIKYEFSSSVLKILHDLGSDYKGNNKKNFPALGRDILNSLSFMEEKDMIKVVKGDYKKANEEFIITINKDNFLSNDNYVVMNSNYLDFIMSSKSSIKKGNLLQVLLYSLSTHIETLNYNQETSETWVHWYQVFSQSNKKTAQAIGISDKTVEKALGVLSSTTPSDNKPLIVYYVAPICTKKGNVVKFPNIYTENSEGWEKRIKKEINYYKGKIDEIGYEGRKR